MSGYNYMNRGNTDDRNKAKYGGFECSDQVCRPVIVDSEGKKRPIISYTPNQYSSESYVTSREKIVEHIRTPVVITTEYQHTSVVAKLEPLKDYGVTTTDKWLSPLSPILDRPQVMVTEHRYTSPTKAEPRSNYGVTNDQWRRPSSPVHDRPQVGHRYSSPPKAEPVKDYGVTNDKWRRPSSPVYDRPQVGFMYSSPTKVEPLKDYEVTDDKWQRPSNPVRDGPQVMATEYVYNSPTKVEPLNNYGVTNNKWQRPSSPVQEYGYDSPTKVKPVKDYGVTNSPILDRSQKVEEFVTRAQPEASRPMRPGLQIATNWHNIPKSMGQGGYADYSNNNNNNNNDWNKPSGNTIRDESLADPLIAKNKPSSGNTIRDENLANPVIANRDERERLGRNGTPLSGPTNDIGKAVEILKEAAKAWPVPASEPAAPQPRMTALASTVPKSDTYKETIDSREAQRRYGKPDQSSRPFQAGATYTGIIDSKEAEKKYKGKSIPRR